jgi:hypothetical protein
MDRDDLSAPKKWTGWHVRLRHHEDRIANVGTAGLRQTPEKGVVDGLGEGECRLLHARADGLPPGPLRSCRRHRRDSESAVDDGSENVGDETSSDHVLVFNTRARGECVKIVEFHTK